MPFFKVPMFLLRAVSLGVCTCAWNSVVTDCRHNVHKDVHGIDSMLFESHKFRLSNELNCLEQTVIKRQQELHEMEEVLEKRKTDLAAIQMEVLFLKLLFGVC